MSATNTHRTAQHDVTEEQVEQARQELEQWAEPAVSFREKPAGTMRRNYERGMATAEYAIGILAAIAVALTLAKFLTGSAFLDPFTKQITQFIGQLGSTIKVK